MVGWKKIRNQLPFGILQVGRVSLAEFGHSPSLPDYLRNALLDDLPRSGRPCKLPQDKQAELLWFIQGRLTRIGAYGVLGANPAKIAVFDILREISRTDFRTLNKPWRNCAS